MLFKVILLLALICAVIPAGKFRPKTMEQHSTSTRAKEDDYADVFGTMLTELIWEETNLFKSTTLDVNGKPFFFLANPRKNWVNCKNLLLQIFGSYM